MTRTNRTALWVLILIALQLALIPPASAQSSCQPTRLPALNSCQSGQRVSLAIVGDVLMHRAIATRGYARGFDTLWSEVRPVLRAADITIANLETPIATGVTLRGHIAPDPGPVFDDRIYTGYPRFNAHPVLIDALQHLGVDLVTLANNHAMDRGPAGLSITLRELDARRMWHTGAVAQGQSRFQALRLTTPLGPLSFIACSFGVNGLPDPQRQVLRCFSDQTRLLTLVQNEAARGAGVIVLPHWGQEYSLRPDARQRRLARALVQAGAIAIVGTHPHVPQPWTTLEADGSARVPVVYSTGNFIAAQTPLNRATAQLAWIELCRGGSGRITAAGGGYVPLQMAFTTTGPVLTLPQLHPQERAQQGLALLERLSPGWDVSGALSCLAR